MDNKKLLLLPTALVGLGLILVGVVAFFSGQQPGVVNTSGVGNFTPTDAAADTAPAQCRKAGINSAVNFGYDAEEFYSRASKFGMGYSLDITSTAAGDRRAQIANNFRVANAYGVTPILRICVLGEDCGQFLEPVNYAQYINQLAAEVAPVEFYAIAGPNEPIAENWVAPGSAQGDFVTIGPAVADYMNKIIDGVTAPNVRLISPAFNLSHPQFDNFFDTIATSGGRLGELQAITGNAYNISATHKIVDTDVARLKAAMGRNGVGSSPIILTETGMFEVSRGTDKATGVANLAAEVARLKDDPQIESFLLFNSFGTNTDPEFDYNLTTDAELAQILGAECVTEAVDPDLPDLPDVPIGDGGTETPGDPIGPGGGDPGTPIVDLEPCPFLNTKARWQEDDTQPWKDSGTIDLADYTEFRVAAFQCRFEDGEACFTTEDIENVQITLDGGQFDDNEIALITGPGTIPSLELTPASVGQVITIEASDPRYEQSANCTDSASFEVVNTRASTPISTPPILPNTPEVPAADAPSTPPPTVASPEPAPPPSPELPRTNLSGNYWPFALGFATIGSALLIWQKYRD